ncbi:MAG: hypothetical protein C0506_06135 [Anaerolinea sp.]|nr:hypothetical protein [Anaerolinea sp.]
MALALYIQAHFEKGHAEVLAECLRGLSSVPADQIEALLALCFSSRNEIVLLGLCDFILEQPPGPFLADLARWIFQSHGQDEIFGYLAAAAIARRRDDLIAALLAALKRETSPTKRKIAAQALELAAPSAAVDEARALLAGRGATG